MAALILSAGNCKKTRTQWTRLWFSLAKPFPSLLSLLPKDTEPREITVDYLGALSILEVESNTVDSVEYLVAALQHHFKTSAPLKVEYFDEEKQDYSPLTDVSALNRGDLAKHKLRVTKVPFFLFLFFFYW